jgi:alpha-L-fucosidase 2
MVRNLLKKGTNPNLLDVHPPFQIDGNFGGCSGIAEMIMQSHYRSNGGEIDLLPALPSDWPKGSVKGLLARGGFVVDASWKEGKITTAKITSNQGGELTVRYNGKSVEQTMKAGQSIELK